MTPTAPLRYAAALSSFYHPVKVVPARPGRRRSTALEYALTTDAIQRGAAASLSAARKGRIISQLQTNMSYIEQFEQELVRKLRSNEDSAAIVRWAAEQVLASYKNGIAAGQKGATVIRKGQSRRPGIPRQSL